MLKKIICMIFFIINLTLLSGCGFVPIKIDHSCGWSMIIIGENEYTIYQIDGKEVTEGEYWMHYVIEH